MALLCYFTNNTYSHFRIKSCAVATTFSERHNKVKLNKAPNQLPTVVVFFNRKNQNRVRVRCVVLLDKALMYT